MSYANSLQSLFQGIALHVEDLFLLEPFQIEYLPDRVPKQEFAVLLEAMPMIRKYLEAMCPDITGFIDRLLKEKVSVENTKTVDENCSDVLWEIADLIVYNKHPEIYDDKVAFVWEIGEILPAKSLAGKVIIDAGAGSGRLAFLTAKFADTVFAVEPAQGFRRFIREKANRENVKNLFTVDGFLDAVPLPDNSADILMTSQALGWRLEDELTEIERVLKPNGRAIHLFRSSDREAVQHIHDVLVDSRWNYEYTEYRYTAGCKRKYYKTIF